MSEPILRVDDLSVSFPTSGDPVRIIRGVSFEVRPGRTLGIVGESGSGKSVTSLAVMGLLDTARPVIHGTIAFKGHDLMEMSTTDRRHLRGSEMAMIFQDPLSSLNPVKTVGGQIAEMFRRRQGASKTDARRRTLEVMRSVGIPDPERRFEQYPHEFSGGMRQRVLIAIAIALSPDLLIADEPTTALDVTVQAQILRLLMKLQQDKGMALIMITHDLAVVADVADDVAIMYAGNIVEMGPLRDVYENPAHPYTHGLLTSVPDLGHRRDTLVPISGSPPNIAALPTGCAFHPRCPIADSRCATETPILTEVVAQRHAACHYATRVISTGVSVS
jgi:oligopeptide transport system ATP-binding protein